MLNQWQASTQLYTLAVAYLNITLAVQSSQLHVLHSAPKPNECMNIALLAQGQQTNKGTQPYCLLTRGTLDLTLLP